MYNTDIRKYASDAGIKLWQIAYALGMNDGNFSRKLRRELSTSEKSTIMAAIDRLKGGNQN